MALKEAFSAWAIAWIGVGAGLAVCLIGVPSWHAAVWNETAAAWASAVGTLAAVWVALNAIRIEARARDHSTAKRARGVAAVFNENLGMAQIFVLAVISMRCRIHDDTLTGAEIVAFSDEAKKLRPIIEDRFAPLVTELPPDVARLVVLADQRLRDFVANELVESPGKWSMRKEALQGFIEEVEGLGQPVAAASLATQALVAPGHAPAWGQFLDRQL